MQECYLMVDVAYQSVMAEEMFQRLFHACDEVVLCNAAAANPKSFFKMKPIHDGDFALRYRQQKTFPRRKQQLLDWNRQKTGAGGGSEVLDFVSHRYKQLCRDAVEGNVLEEATGEGVCFLDLWWKIEILSRDPVIVLFHDVVSQSLGHQIQTESLAQLEAPKTWSSKSGDVCSKSSTRSGKVAFLPDRDPVR